jgi:hypothetical protein
MRPVDTPGANVRGLFDVAMREPKARAVYQEAAAKSYREDLDQALTAAAGAPAKRGATVQGPPAPKTASPLSQVDKKWRDDLLNALDDPGAHQQWVSIARAVFRGKPETAKAFGAQIVKAIRTRLKGADIDALAAIEQRMGSDIKEKLRALGVSLGAGRGRAQAAVARLSQRERLDFTSADDRLSARGTPSRRLVGKRANEEFDQRVQDDTLEAGERAGFMPDEAEELMRQMLRGRRMNYVPPSSARTAMMDAQALPGVVPWNPVGVGPRTGELGYYGGKIIVPMVEQVRSRRAA